MCAKCDASRPPLRQDQVWSLLESRLPPPSIRDDQCIATSSSSCQTHTRRRPDFCWIAPDRIVHVECDEYDSHKDEDVSCHLAKLDDTNWGFEGEHRPTVVIRFNPDRYDGRAVSFVERCNHLITLILFYLQCDISVLDPVRCNVIYMYYHSHMQYLMDAVKEKEETFHFVKSII